MSGKARSVPRLDLALVRRFFLAGLAALALAGCAAAPAAPTAPPSAATVASTAPDGGVLLRDAGFANAPAGFSVPASALITDRIDAANNVTATFSQPGGAEIAAYLREHLPAMGFTVTADGNDSLLFTDGHWDGAFTVSTDISALSLRTDRA